MTPRFEAALVHIGIQKTGSTAIQGSLAAAHAALAAQGILYPVSAGEPHTFLRHYFSPASFHETRARLGRPVPDPPPYLTGFRRLEAELAESGAGRLLLSSELFCTLSPEAAQTMVDWLAGWCARTEALVYVRHPVAFSVSMLQQHVKTGSRTIADAGTLSAGRVLRRRLGAWLSLLGPRNVTVAPFERDALHGGDVVADFFSRAGLPPPEAAAGRRANESLSAAAVYLKSHMNAFARARGRQIHDRPYLSTIPGPRFSLPPDQLARYAAEAAPDLTWLANETGVTLRAPETPPYVPPQESFTTAAVARIGEIAANPAAFANRFEHEAFADALVRLHREGAIPAGIAA